MATQTAKAEQEAENTYNLAVQTVNDIDAAHAEARGIVEETYQALVAARAVRAAQAAMAWQAQQATYSLNQQQSLSLNDLQKANQAAAQAEAAAAKALAKSKNRDYGHGYH